jgi:hypothetical protein
MGELNDENIATCESYLQEFVGRWFEWIDEAERQPLAPEERLAQQAYDHYVREIGYRTDPMNVLAQRAFGPEEFQRRLELRMGLGQIAETRGKVAID